MTTPPAAREAARLIAFYLPQFHPTAENDVWWGKGFTEWTNVARARPLFAGHYQPHIPADLGFYDLRLAEVRRAQAELAQAHGLYAFCYYHYWFGGRRLLRRPFDEVLESGEPDFPFCLCWANENWTRAWDGNDAHVLIGQEYGAEDDRRHARWLVRAFEDRRYVRVAGRPLFLVYRASRLPDPVRTTDIWREEARRRGIGELFLCRVESSVHEQGDPQRLGFDAAVEFQPEWGRLGVPRRRQGCDIYDYAAVADAMLEKPPPPYRRFPCVTPGWDNSPRRAGGGATILTGSTPELYGRWLGRVLARAATEGRPGPLVFVNAWNEWAEGNHLEPCQRWGRAYLEVTRTALSGGAPAAPPWRRADPEPALQALVRHAHESVAEILGEIRAGLAGSRAELATALAELEERERLRSAMQEVAAVVPADDRWILVDDGQWSPSWLGAPHVFPFLERDGHYWGRPADDATAIRELERLRQQGAGFVVFGWPAFWWLDHYAGLHDHLRSEYACALESDRVRVFDLRPGARRPAGRIVAEHASERE